MADKIINLSDHLPKTKIEVSKSAKANEALLREMLLILDDCGYDIADEELCYDLAAISILFDAALNRLEKKPDFRIRMLDQIRNFNKKE